MKRMLIDANHSEETRVAIVDRKQILEFDYASTTRKQIKGNVYLAKVTRVEPSLQAAFVEYGGGRQGFLPFSEIHPDYYQIPVSDREKLMAEVARELQEDAQEEEAEFEERQKRSRRGNRGRGRKVRRRRNEDTQSSGDEKSATKSDSNADEAKEAKATKDKGDAVSSNDTKSEKPTDKKASAETKADKAEKVKAEKADKKTDAAEKTDKKSKPSKDDDGTKYAKKEEPSVSSDVVEDKTEAASTAEGEDAPKEKKKRTRRTPLRGRKRAAKKDEVSEEEATTETKDAPVIEAKTEEKAPDGDLQGQDRLKVNPPSEVGLGVALFSEDKPFDLPDKNSKGKLAKDAKDAADADENNSAEGDDEAIETLDSEEESVKPVRKKRVPFFKRYKIQEVIKRGQVVLVQATKEERGNKGASVTTYLSLAGRYCVLMPNSPRDGGVSRKISDSETRKRLKEVMAQLTLSQGMSVIIRTAGIDRSKTEIRRDFDYLVKLWNQIRDETLSANAPALIYEENNLIKRAIRDLYTSDIDEVLVEGEAGHTEAREFMQMLMPSHTARVKEYKADMPLFYEHGIEDHLASMHDPVVKLKSGGYLVINPTEALISIDVNSGRSTGERNIEETAVKTNVEAAHEVARQLRLRDLAGLIVIDFIDMMDSRNRRSVERNMKDALRSDRAKIQVGRISPFGLMEMSRQRLRPSIGETMHAQCPTCAGRGLVHAPESLALYLVRTLEKEAVSGRFAELKLFVSQEIALYMLNNERSLITGIESRHDVSVTIDVDPNLSVSDYNIEKVKGDKPARGKPRNTKDNSDDKDSKPRRGRGRSRKKDDDNSADNDNSGTSAAENTDAKTESKAEDKAADEQPKKPSRSRSRSRIRSDKHKDVEKETSASKDTKEESTAQKDSESLPEFTKKAAVADKKPAEEKVVEIKQEPSEPLPDTSRPKGAPPRKGWWQQMIELD